MKICVVGCGQVTGFHLPEFRRVFSDIHFVDLDIAKARRDGKAFEGNGRVSSYSQEIPDERFDLGVVNTPNGTHAEIAAHFLMRKIPVFIEKPIALSIRDIQWLEDQEDRGNWITVGFQCRYLPSVRKIRKFSEDKALVFVDCWKHRSREETYYDGWHGTWKHDGGVISQQAAHCVDLVCSLTDEDPVSVTMAGKNIKHDIECEDTAALLIEYPNWLALVHGTTALDGFGHHGGGTGFRVVTRQGIMSCGGFAFEEIYEGTEDIAIDDRRMWETIVHALENGLPSPLSAREAARSMKIIHAAYVSYLEKRPAKYGEICEQLG